MKRLLIVLALVSLACQMSAVAPTVTATPRALPTVTAQEYDEVVRLPGVRYMEVCAWTLNVRGGPGTSHGVTGYLERGEVIRVREWYKGWIMFEAARWVNANYVKEDCP